MTLHDFEPHATTAEVEAAKAKARAAVHFGAA